MYIFKKKVKDLVTKPYKVKDVAHLRKTRMEANVFCPQTKHNMQIKWCHH